MGLETQQKEIAGHVVRVTPFTARRGMKLGGELFKLLGAALGSGLAGAKPNLDKPLDLESLGGAESLLFFADSVGPMLGGSLEKLAQELNPEAFTALAVSLLEKTKVDGREVGDVSTFDIVFAAEYVLLFRVLYFVVEVNFSGPLAGFLTSLRAQVAEAAGSTPDDS